MRQVLFTFSFRKKIKAVLEILFGIGVFIIGVKFLNYIYYEPDYLARIMWKSFYSQENIDTVFLGSSHVYCDVDVHVVDEWSGGNSFDMSTSSQRIQESYYNLLEADRNYDIKNVFVELYYMLSTGTEGDYSDVSSMKVSWRNTDYMRNNYPRLQSILAMNDSEHLPDALMPFVRYRAYLFDWGYIAAKHDVKKTEDYKHFKYHYDFPGNGYYENDLEGKGFWNRNTGVMDSLVCSQKRTAESMGITEDAENYLRKIIQYCQKRGINLTLFISPMYETQSISTEGYDIYLNSVEKIVEEYQVPIYDFNLIKRKNLTLQANDFLNVGHLNSQGAEKFTRVFCNVLEEGYENKSVFFYDSFEERMKEEEPTLYGAYWVTGTDGRIMKIAASDNADMEFKVTLTRDDEEGVEYKTPPQLLLQDFDTNREFIVPQDEHGTVEIIWKMKGEADRTGALEFPY